jgi:hypothetical protein
MNKHINTYVIDEYRPPRNYRKGPKLQDMLVCAFSWILALGLVALFWYWAWVDFILNYVLGVH